MNEIKLKTWILWAVVLFSLGLLADYFFWHLLLGTQHSELLNKKGVEISEPLTSPDIVEEKTSTSDNTEFISESKTEADPVGTPSTTDNFLETLQTCAPEIAAQAIATPEALVEYLQKSVGIAQESISVENYHVTLADGTRRRVHVIASDKSNAPDKKEIRYYKLDKEGYPERLELPKGESLESLLKQGSVTRHELRADLKLKDGSSVQLERHNQKVFEFQYNNQGRVLSCRWAHCQCP
jgi:hypothetical protein